MDRATNRLCSLLMPAKYDRPLPHTQVTRRRRAVVTGLDFSPAAIECARRLSMESGIAATFIQSTVDQTPRLAPGPFDLVFTTWGILCWLPDMRDWARGIASVLAPAANSIALMRIRA